MMPSQLKLAIPIKWKRIIELIYLQRRCKSSNIITVISMLWNFFARFLYKQSSIEINIHRNGEAKRVFLYKPQEEQMPLLVSFWFQPLQLLVSLASPATSQLASSDHSRNTHHFPVANQPDITHMAKLINEINHENHHVQQKQDCRYVHIQEDLQDKATT